MNRNRLLPLVLVVAAAAGGYAFFVNKGGDEPLAPPAVAGPVATQPPLPGPLPASVSLPPPETLEAKASGYIAYPDGTFYPPLNGVKVAPKIQFHARMAPFAKVVGKERDAKGREWYVHENGVRSTTYVNSAGASSYEVTKAVEPQQILPEELPGGAGK